MIIYNKYVGGFFCLFSFSWRCNTEANALWKRQRSLRNMGSNSLQRSADLDMQSVITIIFNELVAISMKIIFKTWKILGSQAHIC